MSLELFCFQNLRTVALLFFVKPFTSNALVVACVVKFHFFFGSTIFPLSEPLHAPFHSIMPPNFHNALRFCTLFRFLRHDLSHTHSGSSFFLLSVRAFVILPGFTSPNYHSVDYFYCWQHCVRMQGPIIDAVTVSDTMQHNSWLWVP